MGPGAIERKVSVRALQVLRLSKKLPGPTLKFP